MMESTHILLLFFCLKISPIYYLNCFFFYLENIENAFKNVPNLALYNSLTHLLCFVTKQWREHTRAVISQFKISLNQL